MKRSNKKILELSFVGTMVTSVATPIVAFQVSEKLNKSSKNLQYANNNFLDSNLLSENNANAENNSASEENKEVVKDRNQMSILTNSDSNNSFDETEKEEQPNQDETEKEEQPQEVKSTIPGEIRKSYDSFFGELEYKNVNVDNGNKKYNISSFNQLFDSSIYKGTREGFLKDIHLYIYKLWEKNKAIASFKKVNIHKFYLLNKNPWDLNVYFNTTSISFSLTIDILPIKTGVVNIANKNFILKANKETTLKIDVFAQRLQHKIYSTKEGFFLSWIVPNVKFIMGDSVWYSDFTPSSELGYSQSFLTKFNNLSSKQNYLDIYQENQKEIKNLTSKDAKHLVEAKFDNEIETLFSFIDTGMEVMKNLKNNETIKDTLINVLPVLLKTLAQIKIVPEFLSEVLIYCFSHRDIKWFKLNEFIPKHKNQLLTIVENTNPEFYETMDNLLSKIRPGLTVNSDDYIEIMDIVKLLPEPFWDVFSGDILGVTSEAKKMHEIILGIFPRITSLLKRTRVEEHNANSDTNNKIISAVVELIDIITNNDCDESLSIWEVLERDENISQRTYKAIMDIASIIPSASNLIMTLFIGEDGSRSVGFARMINETFYSFLSVIFETNSSYTSIHDKYKNIEITKWFYIPPYVPPYIADDRRITFDYRFDITIKKSTKLEIWRIKKWVSTYSILKLIQLTDAQIRLIPGFVRNIIRNAIMLVIPDNFYFGTRENLLTIQFSSMSENIVFKPVKNGTIYNFGYQFQYKTTIFYQDPGLIQGITKLYWQNFTRFHFVIASVDIYYGKIWNDIIQNALLREYEFTSKFVAFDSNKTVGTIDTYDEDLAIPGFEVTRNSSPDLAKNIADSYEPETNKVDQIYSIDKENNYFTWIANPYPVLVGNELLCLVPRVKIVGYKPLMPFFQSEKIFKQMYTTKTGLTNTYDTNLYPEFVIDPILNFKTFLKIQANLIGMQFGFQLDIRVMALSTTLFFPFKYYDTNSGEMVDQISEFITYIKI